MADKNHIPISLKVVAALFILSGLSAMIEIIVWFMHGGIDMNFGVLGIIIGVGLMRRSELARKWALVFTWLGLVGVPIVAVIFVVTPGPLDLKVFGQTVGQTSKTMGVAGAAVAFLLVIWQYRVLGRPDVRALFRVSISDPIASADGEGIR